MNRFRSRKKARPEPDTDIPPVPTFSAKAFLKGKKHQVEEKPQIDLNNALPSTDDFRTSLLMPNLSARFSMLREQDDPSTKIGKASDDSVLFPRRASRLNLFGHNQLGDIAEVSTLAGSARPSLSITRGSYASGDGSATDDDASRSVMNRPRPVEGNNLFGGRQKVYKVAASGPSRSGSTSEASGTSLGGRAMYENDVASSTFQKLKQEEAMRKMEGIEDNQAESNKKSEPEGEGAPLLFPLPENRTSSSTTSLDSQLHATSTGTTTPSRQNSGSTGPERQQTKSRRLYGQGLELQNQQASAINRIESLTRRTAANDPAQITRSVSKSAVSLNERFQKPAPVYTSVNFRPTSPPLSTPSSLSGNVESGRKSGPTNGNQGHGFIAPLSPPLSENEEATALAAAIQHEDRGKATATGLFNRPIAKYDEAQYSQRQLQLHESKNAFPAPRPLHSGGFSEVEKIGRPRGRSTTSYRSKAESVASRYSDSQDDSQPSREQSVAASMGRRSPARPANGTFLANFSESEMSDGEQETASKPKVAPTTQISDNIHPAFRGGSNDSALYALGAKLSNTSITEKPHQESRDLNTIEENETPETNPTRVTKEPPKEEIDAQPTDTPSVGLSGLIRTHLRHDSDKSSIFRPPSPKPSAAPVEYGQSLNPSVQGARESSQAASIHSNPWEYDDWTRPPPASEKPDPPQPAQPDFSSMALRAKQMLGQAAAVKNQGADRPAKEKENRLPLEPGRSEPPWPNDLKSKHSRGISSETQMEREELANELAERRRKVQEKLKSFADTGSRSNSPTPGTRDFGPAKPGNAFAMLKNKANKNPAMGNPDMPMPLRPLGMESANASSPNLSSKDSWRDEEEKISPEFRRQRTASPHIGPQPNWTRPQQPQARSSPRPSQDEARDRFHESPSSWRRPRESGGRKDRDRSISDASGRSKSRPRYRDDLESARRGAESPHRRPSIEDSRPYRGPPSGPSSARPSVETERTGSAMGGRFRSNSRSVAPGYVDSRGPVPLQTGPSPARPPPPGPYSANATPPLYENPQTHSSPATPLSQSQPNHWNQSLGMHRRTVDKAKISEPKLVSSTSNVPTVGLPPGASLSNGTSPPIPPMNPRRRRPTTTQTIFSAFKHTEKDEPMPSPAPGNFEEQSTFSDEDKHSRPRQRLRKISSEGGNMNVKARQQAMTAKAPAMPQTVATPIGPVPLDGGMF